ncbi:glutathione reductase [Haematococcus lacustris]
MADEYDLVTIGAGSGGVRASRFAAQLYNAKVACVELPFGFISSDTVGGAGGTCVIRGCVPKKLLVYGSHVAEELADAAGLGWELGSSRHEWSTLVKNKAKEVTRLNATYNSIMKNAGVELVEGRASLVDAKTVEVQLAAGGSRVLKAKNILVAVGGTPSRLDIPGAELSITSDEALSLEALPSGPIVVLGSGYIAVEFAGIFKGLGGQVHLMFRADCPLRGFDMECRTQIAENLGKRGIQLHPGCNPTRIEQQPDGSKLLFYKDSTGQEQSMTAELIMMATGRKAKTKNIGLEAAGVTLAKDGSIPVDEYSRTNVEGVWAIGDVTNRINLTPVALMEGMAFAKSCFGNELTKPDYDNVASAVFCQPPMASVGYSEEEAVAKLSGDLDIFVSKFKPMKYTMSGRDERTLMKLVVHVDTDRVVGAHMVGPDSPEIMQGIAIAFKCGATKKQFDSTVGIHPSAAEEFVTMRSKTRRVKGQGNIVPRL